MTPWQQIHELTEHFPRGVYIAGGAARAYMRYGMYAVSGAVDETHVRDIDVFAASEEHVGAAWVVLTGLGYRHQQDKGAHVKTYTRDGDPLAVDLVGAWFAPSLHALFGGFDLVCCQFGWSLDGGWTETPGARADLDAGRIRVNRVSPPVSVMQRIERYIARGWKTDASVWPTMAQACRQCDAALLTGEPYEAPRAPSAVATTPEHDDDELPW